MRGCACILTDFLRGALALLEGQVQPTEHVPTPTEWLAAMADPLLAQSAIDRLQSAAYELIVEGQSYRRRQKPKTKSAR